MKYILDSDTISALIDTQSEEYILINNFIEDLEKDSECYVCILTIYEVEYNISSFRNKKGKEKAQKTLDMIIKNFPIITLGLEDAKVYGNLKNGFREKTGINKNALKRHNIDIAIASVAIKNNLTLISSDSIYLNHLQVINSELQYQNWKNSG